MTLKKAGLLNRPRATLEGNEELRKFGQDMGPQKIFRVMRKTGPPTLPGPLNWRPKKAGEGSQVDRKTGGGAQKKDAK